MAIKDILVISSDPRGAAERIGVAAAVAAPEHAHLSGLYLTAAVGLFSAGLPYSGRPSEFRAVEEMEAQERVAAAKAADGVATLLREAAARAGLTHDWRLVEGDIAPTAVLHARHADIAVIGQGDPDHRGAAHNVIETVLLGAGRPVLAVPYAGHFATVGKNVLVAWNASREAARALSDAMPILARADKVTVLSINPPGEEAGRPSWAGAEIAPHLARHGVTAEVSATVSHDIDAGNILLSRASDFGADLIVMGGYGHSRQRELILGGMTRTILQHMTVPVLLSH